LSLTGGCSFGAYSVKVERNSGDPRNSAICGPWVSANKQIAFTVKSFSPSNDLFFAFFNGTVDEPAPVDVNASEVGEIIAMFEEPV